MDWRPTASLIHLHLRATILAKIRTFFAERQVLEVETPLLSHATVTDVHLHSFKTDYTLQPLLIPPYQGENNVSPPAQKKNNLVPPDKGGKGGSMLYLQTSPEFAMKRLLAAGSGPIYQITKAFRNEGELGRFHNPEFTMLEWYRPGFNHHDLMDEVDDFLQLILQTAPAERSSYAEAFAHYADLNPHTISLADLKNRTQQLIPELININQYDHTSCLHLILSHIIEPQFGQHNRPTFLYDFPVAQAALARIRPDNPPVAERFEVYLAGIELANGFHELADAQEQRQRFINDLSHRQTMGYPTVPVDEHLLAALQHGLPNCAGIALGIDRLIMLAAKANTLAEVMSFSFENA